MAQKKAKACPECRQVFEIPQGNPGWCITSNPEMKAKSKKALAILAYSAIHGRDPDEKERKAWENELNDDGKKNKDDFAKIKVVEPTCPNHPDTRLSNDWQGFTILLDPSRSEVARALGIVEPGSYALKVRHQ